MYHFQKSFNPNYKTLHLTLELYKNKFSLTNYELKIKAKKIKKFNKLKKNLYLLPSNLSLQSPSKEKK